MKRAILLGLTIVLITACNQKQRYTQQSPEIDSFKSVIKSYNDQDWEGMTKHYADTAKTYNNSSDVGLSLEDMVAFHKESLTNLSTRGFLDNEQEYEMVVTDKGDTWVNFWGDWEGTLKANNTKIKIPIHLTAQFKDGKIVRSSGNWDNAPMVLALQAIEAKKNEPETVQKIRATYEAYFELLNNQGMDDFHNIATKDFTRYANGIKEASNPAEQAAVIKVFHKAYPDFNITHDNLEIRDGKSYSNWTVTGTNTGSFGDIPASGKKSVTHGYTICHYDLEGKLTDEHVYFDMSGVYEQLGYTLSPPK